MSFVRLNGDDGFAGVNNITSAAIARVTVSCKTVVGKVSRFVVSEFIDVDGKM